MRIELQVGGESILLVSRWEPVAAGRVLALGDRFAALAWLGRVAREPGAMRRIRRLAAEQLPLHHLDDAGALDWLARQISSGRLRMVALPGADLTGIRGEDVDPEPSSARSAAVHWITVELVGEDNTPIAGERYRVELPDGSVREGRLDGAGLARIRGIPTVGACSVTFPDLDEDAWSSLGTNDVP